jgi:hypothetical protein
VNEMFNFFGNWSLSRAQTGSQTSDTTHHCVVTDADDNTFCGTWNETKMTSTLLSIEEQINLFTPADEPKAIQDN